MCAEGIAIVIKGKLKIDDHGPKSVFENVRIGNTEKHANPRSSPRRGRMVVARQFTGGKDGKKKIPCAAGLRAAEGGAQTITGSPDEPEPTKSHPADIHSAKNGMPGPPSSSIY